MTLISLVSAIIFSQLKTSNFWREHSYQVLETAETFRSNFFNILRNAREYLITGQAAALQFSEASARSAYRQLTQLKMLTRDNPGQNERLNRISAGLEEMIADSQLLVDAYNAHGIQAAAQLESNGQGVSSINRTSAEWEMFTEE